MRRQAQLHPSQGAHEENELQELDSPALLPLTTRPYQRCRLPNFADADQVPDY